jgi:Na+/proline symporter
MSTTAIWSWIFLVGYVGLMVYLGTVGMKRVFDGDDFAVARSSYGPVFLAFSMAGTTASGATFVGIPGLAYKFGVSTMWYACLYPIGIYGGMFLCMKAVTIAGHTFGNRSIPEFLGDRFQSDFLRLAVAVFSLMLLFYIAGQLVAGVVMFERLLGLSPVPSLIITGVVLLIYLSLGGAHADILTDAVQGFLMLALAIFAVWLFFTGYGLDGGFSGMISRLEALDDKLIASQNPASITTFGWWALAAMIISHVPFGMLPHIGNKLWALDTARNRYRFMTLAFIFGMTLPMITLAGILARASLGDSLLTEGTGANQAIPGLFLHVFPPVIAAFLNIGILAAVMSTADGLVISSSQVFANDIYRRTIAPRWHKHKTVAEIDRITLIISRVATATVIVVALAMAYAFMDKNIALLIWIGAGGMMGALAGPIMVGLFWRGTTKAGAICGLFVGASVFIILKAGLIDAAWFGSGATHAAAAWLFAQAPNPFSCAAIAQICSVTMTILVSYFSRPLSAAHLARVFETGEA